jgi:hypothetical protein
MVASTLSASQAARPARRSFAPLGFALTLLALLLGWLLPTQRLLTPQRGLGYALGIVGGSMMLALLIYPLRKRVAALRVLGGIRPWFRVHMILGIVGPVLILYHANFSTGATNSNVALACMLVVAGSGVIGRYLYARIHHGLYGHKATLEEIRSQAERLRASGAGGRMLPQLHPLLEQAEARIARGVPGVPSPVTAWLHFRLERWRVQRYLTRGLKAAAASSAVVAEHADAFAVSARRYVDQRLDTARRIAEFAACEKLFALWHVLHMPLFFMLLIAGIVHVVAVHVY